MQSSSGLCYYGEGDPGPRAKWARTRTYLFLFQTSIPSRLAGNVNPGFSWSSFPTSPFPHGAETGEVHLVSAASTQARMAEGPRR